ncbi:hypothetical protein T484DRAFT_1851711, partial [Baffinella frigidus]
MKSPLGNPKLVAAYLGRGTAQALQGNLAQASKDFTTVTEIDPKCSDGWKRRGQTRAALGFDSDAVKARAALRFDAVAMKDLPKAAETSPDHECFHQRGLVDLTKAAEISPDHECFHQRGIVHHKMHDYRKGLKDFRKALDMESRKLPHKMHDYRKGLKDFRKALDMEPRNPITWNFVGLCENALG